MERRGKFKAANPEAESYLAQSRCGGSGDSEAIPYRTCERQGYGTGEFEWQCAEHPSRLIRGGCSELHQGTRFYDQRRSELGEAPASHSCSLRPATIPASEPHPATKSVYRHASRGCAELHHGTNLFATSARRMGLRLAQLAHQ